MMRKKRDYLLDDIHRTPDVAHIQNPDVSHEKSDVNVRLIVMFAGGLLVFGLIVKFLISFMFSYLEDHARRMDPPPRPMALSERERIPPAPRLQGAPGFGVDLGQGKQPINLELKEPAAEYNEMRQIWDDDLKGLPDPRTGQSSMPMDEAKQKVLQSGQLQSRPQADGQQPINMQGMDVPSFQSSGRMTEKRDQ